MANLAFDDVITAFAYKSDKELKRSKFLYSLMGYPLFVPIATRLTPFLIKTRLPFVKNLMRHTIFKQFVGGESLEQTEVVAGNLGKYNVQVILDYGIEGLEGETNFDKATQAFIKVIQYAATRPNIPFISVKVSAFARHGLLQALNEAPRLRSGIHDHEAQEAEWDKVCERMYSICEAAAKHNIGVLVDAEESWLQDPVDRLTMEMMEEFNTEKPIVYNTIQLYRHDRLNFLQLSHKIAQSRNFILGVKLVRGAYMEKERSRAEQKGFPSLIQPTKEKTDQDYNQALVYCIDNIKHIAMVVATHNEKSNQLVAQIIMEKRLSLDHPHVHFSQLYGMSDNITFILAKSGFSVSKYLPFGSIGDVVPYLMRRAQENSSVSGQTSRELYFINQEVARRKAFQKK